MTGLCSLVPWRWIAKAAKCLLGGVFASFVLLAMASSLSEEQRCSYDCSLQIWMNPVSVHHPMFQEYVMEHVIDPPQAHPEDPITEEEARNPYYNDQMDWFGPSALAAEYLQNVKNGTFVVVGAGDGFHRSFTAKLEVLGGWNGLLIEPRVDVYSQLRKRRKAAAANVCASVTDFHTKAKLWTPNVEEDIPAELKQSAESRAALLQFVVDEDRPDGRVSEVQCYKLETLIDGYLAKHEPGRDIVHLLVLDSATGEFEIFDNLPRLDRYYMVLVHFRDEQELTELQDVAQSYKLRMVSNESKPFNYAIFLHNSVEVVLLSEEAAKN